MIEYIKFWFALHVAKAGIALIIILIAGLVFLSVLSYYWILDLKKSFKKWMQKKKDQE